MRMMTQRTSYALVFDIDYDYQGQRYQHARLEADPQTPHTPPTPILTAVVERTALP